MVLLPIGPSQKSFLSLLAIKLMYTYDNGIPNKALVLRVDMKTVYPRKMYK